MIETYRFMIRAIRGIYIIYELELNIILTNLLYNDFFKVALRMSLVTFSSPMPRK